MSVDYSVYERDTQDSFVLVNFLVHERDKEDSFISVNFSLYEKLHPIYSFRLLVSDERDRHDLFISVTFSVTHSNMQYLLISVKFFNVYVRHTRSIHFD